MGQALKWTRCSDIAQGKDFKIQPVQFKNIRNPYPMDGEGETV